MLIAAPSQVSAGITISGRNSVSGTMFTSRPSRARDLVTMVEAGLTPGRVKTASDQSPGELGRNPTLDPDRSARPTLRFGIESIFITGNFTKLVTH